MTAGIILAAGDGSRFGAEPKQLAELGGRPVLQWAIDAQCAADPMLLDPIVLVLGARAATVRARIDPRRARVVVCERWREGQSASLRRGLEALAGHAGPVLVTLGDAPFVTPEVVDLFARQPRAARATYGGRPGHPVVLGDAELRALAGNTGDRGARAVLGHAQLIEVSHLGDGSDLDTPEDLRRLRARLQADSGDDLEATGPSTS